MAEGVEEEGEKNVVEKAVSLSSVALEEVEQIGFATVAGRAAEPALLLEEPEEKQPAKLPSAEGEEGEVFLRVLARQGRMARIGPHEREHELVAEVPEFLVELLRDRFHREGFAPPLGEGGEALHTGGVEASQKFQVEAARRLQVHDRAGCPRSRALTSARQDELRFGFAVGPVVEHDRDPAAVLLLLLDKRARESAPHWVALCGPAVPLIRECNVETGSGATHGRFPNPIKLADAAGKQFAGRVDASREIDRVRNRAHAQHASK